MQILLPPSRGADPANPAFASMEGLIVREIHHRLKNTLTILACQLQHERDAPEHQARAAIDRSVQVICAHGRLQGALILDREGPASVPDYVALLCRRISDAILEPLGIRCETVADEGMLPAATLQALGLIIHELAINAAKHAFTGPSLGVVHVEVLQHPGAWSCTVTDNGRGLLSQRDPDGLGGGIVKGLVEGFGGSVALRTCAAGVSVAVLLPNVC